MSSRIRFATVRNVILALSVAALLSPVARAADPKAHSPAGTPAKKERAKTPAPLPPSQPKPAAVRSPAALTPQTPFSEAIDILRDSTTPPLPIVVLWKQLADGAGVYRETPIGLDGMAGLRAGQCLDLLMLSLSAGASAKLGYVVNQGVITISTTDALPAPKPITRVYDISDLVAPPARYSLSSLGFGMGYGGLTAPFGGYAGSTFYGANSVTPSNPLSISSRTTRLSPRTYPSR
jgi:hypothetical protein